MSPSSSTRKWILTGCLWACATGPVQAETPKEIAVETQSQSLTTGLQLHQLRDDAATPDLDVYGSYEEAQQLEAEIVQMYREIRAAELSLIQRQTLGRSLEATLTPLSERAKVDQALLTEKAKDAETVKVYQKELGVVMQETDAIVSNANELLASFMQNETPPPPPPPEAEDAPEPLTPEEAANRMSPSEIQEQNPSADAPPPPQSTEQLQQQQTELQQEIDQNVEEVKINLEEALTEIAAAKEQVTEKIAETEKEIAEKEQELATEEKPETQELEEALKQQKENVAELKELDEKVDTAKEVVEEVVVQLKDMQEVPEEQVEKAEEIVKDLREALAAVMEADEAVPETQDQQVTKAHTEKAVEQVQSAQAAMEAAAEAMAEMQKLSQMLAMMERAESETADMEIARMQALEIYSRARVGKWIDLTEQMRGKNLNAKPVEVPEGQHPEPWENRDTIEKAPSSRKIITSGTRGGEWVFVGDWYVLSRYDNANRANIQKVYPPESILDIDAHYRSEDGKPMEWEYESFQPPRMKPHAWESWKIYYFYTEIHFEEASEVWLAIGSDDRSDVWINDLPVWHSSNEHKEWNPKEGFRKVYFRQGRNKVLVRLENGQFDLGFSMFMRLPDPIRK